MKLGNVSQTIVQVPKFFYDTTREIDAFKSNYRHMHTIKNEHRHFSFSDSRILQTNLDININNNPRLIKDTEKFNKELYLPLHKRFFTPNFKIIKKPAEEIAIKKYNPKHKIIKKFLNYKKKMNINETLCPKVREELMSNTYNLIDRINNDYDLTLYSNFDSRVTLNKHLNKRYSILPYNHKDYKFKTDKEIFRKVLTNKINSLRTINPKVKEIIQKLNNKKNLYLRNEENKKNPERIKRQINSLLLNCHTNYLKLKYNNRENFFYNKQDQQFIDKYQSLTSRINNNKKSVLYNEFPSKTRMEFGILRKKILNPKKILKNFSEDTDNSFIQNRKEYGTDTYNILYKNLTKNMWNRPLHEDAFKLETINK